MYDAQLVENICKTDTRLLESKIGVEVTVILAFL